jgi:protein disulfide-isomerase
VQSKFYFIAFLFFFTFSQAQETVLKWETDINKAINDSVEQDKKALIFFTGSDWCGWCVKLQKEVFQKEEFANWAKDYILVELDFPRRKQVDQETLQRNQQIQQIFQVQGYPAVFIVKPAKTEDGKINLNALARTGYVAGGPEKWIESVEQFFKPQG